MDRLSLPTTFAPAQSEAKSPNVARTSRRLHLGHFAFMRALVQGMDLRESWSRYLRAEGEGGDLRTIRAMVAWIRDEFAAAARREHRPGTARLVVMEAPQVQEAALPSLELFAAERGMEGYSEAEQIEAYEAQYGGASKRLRRRAALIEKQLNALRWLEGLVAQAPRAGDDVGAWLNPALAGHLEVAGIRSLSQLMERINGVGRGWSRGIDAIGTAKAARILEWLRAHESTIGIPVGRHVSTARSKLYSHELAAITAPATEIRPLEKFIVPLELDGSRGAYRREQKQCLLLASTDYEAILAWIRSKHGLSAKQKLALKTRRRHRDSGFEVGLEWLQNLSNTQRAYRKEAERFLLWAIVHRGKAMSSMTQEDCVAYRDFLVDPQPRARWCGHRGRERWSPLWRPFEGPLSASAQRQAITILRNLYGFLVDQNYLMGNPWSGVSVAKGPAKINAGRSFTAGQWHFIQREMGSLPQTSANRRLRFALHLLYATGLRLSEVVSATVDDLQRVEYPADAEDDEPVEGWLLRVVGKGQKEREVPVPDEVIDEMSAYLSSRKLDRNNQGAALLGKASDIGERAPQLLHGKRWAQEADPREGIAASTLYDQIKHFFGDCAAVLAGQGDHKGASRLALASTHWMRHTHASHAIARGMPIQIAQQNLGHASLATTTVYVTTENKKRMKAARVFWSG